jgi:cytochrome c553
MKHLLLSLVASMLVIGGVSVYAGATDATQAGVQQDQTQSPTTGKCGKCHGHHGKKAKTTAPVNAPAPV